MCPYDQEIPRLAERSDHMWVCVFEAQYKLTLGCMRQSVNFPSYRSHAVGGWRGIIYPKTLFQWHLTLALMKWKRWQIVTTFVPNCRWAHCINARPLSHFAKLQNARPEKINAAFQRVRHVRSQTTSFFGHHEKQNFQGCLSSVCLQ